MMLTKKQAYLATFHYLDKLYDEKPDETLGDLLSSMNPYLFNDSNSADPATWFDWVKCIELITKNDQLSPNDVFQAMIYFIRFHEQEFGYEFSHVLKRINSTGQDQKWIDSINSVQE